MAYLFARASVSWVESEEEEDESEWEWSWRPVAASASAMRKAGVLSLAGTWI